MADGSWTREASVAPNHHPLGTALEVTPAPTGRRRWVVRDRIGWGTELDFWRPSCGLALGGAEALPQPEGQGGARLGGLGHQARHQSQARQAQHPPMMRRTP